MRFSLRNTLLRIPVLWLALTLPALPSQALAFQDAPGDPPENAQNQPSAAIPAPGELKYSRFHKVLGRNLTSNLFSKRNLLPFLIGSAGALAIAPADQEISDALRGESPEIGSSGNYIGNVGMVSLVAGSVLASQFTKSEHFHEFSYTLAQAYSTTWLLTQGVKYATNRTRPDGSDSLSLPSGHVSGSFTASTIVWEYYGWKWGVPLYAVSTLVAVSRIEDGRHWPSDTVAGATLGILGANAALIGTKRELAGRKITGLMVMPIYGHDRRGVSISLSY